MLDYLQQSAERTPNALALVDDNQQWRYQAMLERIEQLAAGFTELGLGCGDNVVLQLGNVAEFYLCFSLCCAKAYDRFWRSPLTV